MESQLGFLLSPDGQYLLFGSQPPGGPPHLVLRSIDSGSVRPLPATDGATGAFWSPDSRTIAFVSRGALKKISVSGGAPEVLAPSGVSLHGCWGPDGFIVMNPMGGISKVPAAGGEPVPVTTVDRARGELHHELPACLPDGRFLYFRHLNVVGTSGIYLGDPSIPPDKQPLTPVLVAADGPVFVPGSATSQHDLMFMQDQTLFVQPFDVNRIEFIGQPTRLAAPVASSFGSGYFSASATGLLIYADAPNVSRQLTWIDRNGTIGASVGPVIRVLRGLRLAPTGQRAAVGMFPQETLVNNDDVWVFPLDGVPPTRLTSAESVEMSPVFAPDGTRVAYMNPAGSSAGIYQQTVDGGPPEQIVATPVSVLTDWSWDGRFILFTRNGAGTGQDVWVTPTTGSNRTAVPLIQSLANETAAVFSPDCHWLAYLSNETGRLEVYVRRFELSADGVPTTPETGRRLVSAGARGLVRWPRDGRELVYMSADGRLMSVAVTTTPALVTSPPRALFTFPEAYLRVNSIGAGIADIAPDGSRVLVGMPPADAAPPGLHAIVNWRTPVR